MNCENCEYRAQEKQPDVPFLVHESAMARMERANKRAWAIVIILLGILAGALVYSLSFETVVQEVQQEADNGTNNFAGGDYFGETDYPDQG